MKLIINCGTTNLRVLLTDEDGSVLSEKHSPNGVRNTAIDGRNTRLKTALKDTIDAILKENGYTDRDISDCVAYGMITSNLGLLEIPHLPAPADRKALHDGMRTRVFPEIAPFPIRFIPGVKNSDTPVNIANFGRMDMMRGEETEAVGLNELLGLHGPAVFILPGSHQKFIRIGKNGEILGCMTSISGELLEAVSRHTVLADSVGRAFASPESYVPEMVREGAAEAMTNGLGRAAFSGRILSTLGKYKEAEIQSFLLGAVLSEDVRAMRVFMDKDTDTPVYIAGSPLLNRAFSEVIRTVEKRSVVSVSEEASAKMGIIGALKILK